MYVDSAIFGWSKESSVSEVWCRGCPDLEHPPLLSWVQQHRLAAHTHPFSSLFNRTCQLRRYSSSWDRVKGQSDGTCRTASAPADAMTPTCGRLIPRHRGATGNDKQDGTGD